MTLQSLLNLMFEGSANNNVETVPGSFNELKRTCTVADLPVLVTAMQSEQSDFWVPELLSEPIAQIGGWDYLPVLFDALER